jgi:hypothetical protein
MSPWSGDLYSSASVDPHSMTMYARRNTARNVMKLHRTCLLPLGPAGGRTTALRGSAWEDTASFSVPSARSFPPGRRWRSDDESVLVSVVSELVVAAAAVVAVVVVVSPLSSFGKAPKAADGRSGTTASTAMSCHCGR